MCRCERRAHVARSGSACATLVGAHACHSYMDLRYWRRLADLTRVASEGRCVIIYLEK